MLYEKGGKARRRPATPRTGMPSLAACLTRIPLLRRRDAGPPKLGPLVAGLEAALSQPS
jgi:hypothetical protein